MFDTLIRGGTVVDGTGAPGVVTDIGIRDARVQAVGPLASSPTAETLDATGLVVSPGFIDMHTHSDLSLMGDPCGHSKIRQGVTTELVGHCGVSPFPIPANSASSPGRAAHSPILGDPDWTDLEGYASRIAHQGSAINIAPLVGHGSVREAVMGYDDRPPTPEELRQMGDLVARAMDQGAFGLSAGLTLAPGRYADLDELVSLCRIVADQRGIFDVHGRFWAGWHFRGASEAIDIGRRAGLPVQIAHLAIIDSRRWRQAERLTDVIDEGVRSGVDVTFDVYPYTAAGSPLSQLLPGWVQEGGLGCMLDRLRDPQAFQRALDDVRLGWFKGLPWAWDTLVVASPGSCGGRSWTGRSIEQLAVEWGVEPAVALLQLVERSEDGIHAVMHNRIEEDMQHFLRHGLSMVGSDGNAIAIDGPHADALVHPRYYGAHARVLGRYVRDLQVLTLEEAVHKMTGRPAARLGLTDRGRVAPGSVADLALFRPGRIADQATFEAPHQYAVGVPHVMVGGEWVIRDGEHTGALPTGVIRQECPRH